MFGKQFLVTDSLHTIEWEITGEQRQIGQYPAIKAIGTKKNNSLDWSSFRRRQPKNAEEKKKDSIAMKEGRFEDVYEQADEIKVIAWFTPAIPVQHGPAEYGGLPGLILELNAGETTLLCSKVVMNPAEPEEIKNLKKVRSLTRKTTTNCLQKKCKRCASVLEDVVVVDNILKTRTF
ncbi:GLPGLI family protein [Nonlabens tegetincola]|uniref:GLPGLI family protein n=1 Tax=Nonlabens tegetincola TaxID=323273 RepID=UPI001C61260A|nr:GLPGLI family protein [Nonlabens tegetincola]